MTVSLGILCYVLLMDSAETLWTNYVVVDMECGGGPIRVLMNAGPAVPLFAYRKRLVLDAQ